MAFEIIGAKAEKKTPLIGKILFATSSKFKQPSLTVEKFDEELSEFVEELTSKMFRCKGFSLAASQVGDKRQVIIVDFNTLKNPSPTYKMVNPIIKETSEETVISKEQSLSTPGITIDVERFQSVTLEWQDVKGEKHTETFSDFPATLFQQAIDHLNGITLLNHLSDLKRRRYLTNKKTIYFSSLLGS